MSGPEMSLPGAEHPILPPRLPHQPPNLQNHLYKVIYVRHAKVASSTVLDYFGLCNDELKGGRPRLERWWL